MLLAVERGHNWFLLPRLTSQFERNLRIVEPEAKVELMGWGKLRCGAARGNREGLRVEDAAYLYTTIAVTVCFQVTLIPGDAKGLIWNFDHKEIVPRICCQPTHLHLHLIIE